MRVPRRITPQTSPQVQGPTYFRGSAPDLSGIGAGVNEIVKTLEDNRRRREQFDVRKAIIEETNALQQDFDARKEATPLGAENFATDTKGVYETRHAGLLEKYRELGFSHEAIQELDLGLAPIRSHYLEKSIEFQNVSYNAKVDKDLDGGLISVSQYAAANSKDGVLSALEQWDELVNLPPNITAVERERRREIGRKVILEGSRKSFVEQHPDLVLQHLAPKELLSEPVADAVSDQFLKDREGFAEKAYWDVNHFRVGYGSDTITLADGTVRPTREGDVITQADAERDFTRRMNELKGDLSERVPGWDQLPSSSKTALISVAYNYGVNSDRIKSLFEVAGNAKALAGAIEYLKNDNNGVNHGRRLLEAELVRNGGGTTASDTLTTGAALPSDVKTGIAILDLSTGEERMQMLAAAQSKVSANNAEVKAAARIAHENALTAFSNGEDYPGTVMSEEQYKATFGEAVGGQMFAELSSSQEAKTKLVGLKQMTPAEMQATIASLKPSDPETYAVQQKVYDAAQNLAENILKQREDDPAAYIYNAFPNVSKAMQNAKDSAGRKAAFAALGEAYRRIGVTDPADWKPFTKDQAAKMVEIYKQLPPQAKIAQLHQWLAELPQDKNSNVRFAFMRQMDESGAPGDFTMLHVLWDHPNRDAIAERVVAGKAKIENNEALKITREWSGSLYRGHIKSALTHLGDRYSNYLHDISTALYIEMGGSPVKPLNPAAEKKLFSEAFRLAVGGLPNNKDTGFIQHDKGITILPPTVTRQEFDDWQEGLTGFDLRGAEYESGKPAIVSDVVDNGRFIMVDTDVYRVQLRDGKFLRNSRGNYFQIKINPAVIRGPHKVR